MNAPAPARAFPASFGRSPRRVEDLAILTGKASYPTDARALGEAEAYVLRSSAGHARISVGGLETARKASGVVGILVAADVEGLASLPNMRMIKNRDGSEAWSPPYRVLASDIVRHVGEPIAFIVAETLAQARDAAERIEVDYEPLPAVTSIADALAKGAPLVWPDQGTNLLFDGTFGDEPAATAALAKAHRTIEIEVINNRLVANYMEPRSALAVYDPKTDQFTLTAGSQGVHFMRDSLAKVLKVPEANIRVITPPDVGGGFGTKFFVYREYPLALIAAKTFGRPVRWIGDRTEHFIADSHGRDNLTRATLALDADNRFIGLAIDLCCNMGAYLSEFGASLPAFGIPLSPGLYAIPAVHVRVRAVMTNTQPVDAYRGAGRPEAAYLIERLVDTAARDLGISPEALRRRNFIKPKAMPYTTATQRVYDSGDFAGHMGRAQEIIDWKGFGKRAAASKKSGKLRGIGLATYIEACGNNGPDAATVRLDPDGNITVLAGSQSTGQGHKTAYAQLVAEHLDVPPERVTVIQGDTDLVATGAGTGGSSSITCGGASVDSAARRLAVNLKSLAAHELEAAETDLEIENGQVRIAGTDRTVSFAQLAASGRARPEQLAVSDSIGPPQPTYPNGTHVAEVEIDPDTGHIDILSYVVVDDFGVTLNPLLLAGQVHGGAVQGIGQAMMENTVYDGSSGQLVTASLMDYALPRASDTPPFAFETRNVRCATNPLGVKGAGEAGTIGAAPAVMNAIVDAMHRAYRIRHVDMPATPERVWAAIREGKRVHTL